MAKELSFWEKLGFKSLTNIDGLKPLDRVQRLYKKEHDPETKTFLQSIKTLMEKSDTASYKMSMMLKMDARDRKKYPLQWANGLLAAYQGQKPVFTHEAGQMLRDALKDARDQIAGAPDDAKQKLFHAIKEDIKEWNLTTLNFLDEPEIVPEKQKAMTMPTLADMKPPSNDNQPVTDEEEKKTA